MARVMVACLGFRRKKEEMLEERMESLVYASTLSQVKAEGFFLIFGLTALRAPASLSKEKLA